MKKNTNYQPKTAEILKRIGCKSKILNSEPVQLPDVGRSMNMMGYGELGTSCRHHRGPSNSAQLCKLQTERYESSFGCKHRQQKLAHHKMKVKAQMAIKNDTPRK